MHGKILAMKAQNLSVKCCQTDSCISSLSWANVSEIVTIIKVVTSDAALSLSGFY
jgi:hypothetical protein